ncbi:hypothetical protein ccbrp13_15020 [Ktedonobacteria bacterium brp13]|nr:hypothetical protein ccbrp13_15020 [Ktedonobacteria bacterium brp13]
MALERAAAERERERVLKCSRRASHSSARHCRQALRFWQETRETTESQLVHGLSVAVTSD